TATLANLVGSSIGVNEQAFGFAAVAAVSDHGGSDTAYLNDATGQATYVASPGTALLVGPSFQEQAAHFQSVVGVGAGGSDLAYLYDAAANDPFAATPSQANLSGSGLSEQEYGFAAVAAIHQNGGSDVAFFSDSSAGNATFVAAPSFALLVGSGFSEQAYGF